MNFVLSHYPQHMLIGDKSLVNLVYQQFCLQCERPARHQNHYTSHSYRPVKINLSQNLKSAFYKETWFKIVGKKAKTCCDNNSHNVNVHYMNSAIPFVSRINKLTHYLTLLWSNFRDHPQWGHHNQDDWE